MKNSFSEIKNNEILNGYNFSKSSDLIYSEIVPNEEYSKMEKSDKLLLTQTDEFTLYRLKTFEIKENQTIFCNTVTVNSLFKQLKKAKDIKNIKLITHQSDISITEDLFSKKPQCIEKWYSVNVQFKNSNLIPIPLGIANFFQKKYLNTSNYPNSNMSLNINKNAKMYLNFQKNTNLSERENLLTRFENKEWVTIEEPNLSIEKYIERLGMHTFVLCPWGNGVDTHRLWEALYNGNIPITKYHQTFDQVKSLPILFVESYTEITKDLLVRHLSNYKEIDYNLNLLNLGTWMEQILKNDNSINGNTERFRENSLYSIYSRIKFKIVSRINSKIKIIKYLLKQILKLANKIIR